MKRYRRLRRLVPDADLVRRGAAGETLRELSADYGVAHTTLSRYFQRPQVALEVGEARRQQREAAARQARDERLQRRAEREVRRRAKQQRALERQRESARAAAQAVGRRRRRGSAYMRWLDERDARQPVMRADSSSRNDQLADQAIAADGGLQEVLEATGLRTLEN